MGGIELVDGTLVVGREPNELDELAMDCSALLDELDVAHVFVSGYVAILAGRSRSTEDIDVLVERLDDDDAGRLVDALTERGFWGPAMPLSALGEMPAAGDPIWIAPDGDVSPHLEVTVVDDRFDRASLEGAISAVIDDATLPIGPLELQIAYKLYLGAQRDFEDAVHLYTLFGETLSGARLQAWSEELGVEDAYDRLKRA